MELDTALRPGWDGKKKINDTDGIVVDYLLPLQAAHPGMRVLPVFN